MNIVIYADPAFRDTLWFTHTYRGIREEAKRKKHTPILLEDIPPRADTLKSCFPKGKAVVIVMGASVPRLHEKLDRLWRAGIHTILVNFREEIPFAHSSTLIMDYAGAVRQGMGYLTKKGAGRIALFGVTRFSGPDEIKARTYLETAARLGMHDPEGAVYSFDGTDLQEGCERFLADASKYDGILFGNDIAAMALTRCLRERGMTGHFHMAGFADPTLTDFKLLLPEVVPLSTSHSEFGQQAVNLYTWLANTPQQISVTVHIPVEIDCASGETWPDEPGEFREMTDFSPELTSDPLRNEILLVEKCIRECDETDIATLRALLRGKTKANVAEEIFLTERAIKYRLKKMCENAGVANQKQLLARLRPWLCDEL